MAVRGRVVNLYVGADKNSSECTHIDSHRGRDGQIYQIKQASSFSGLQYARSLGKLAIKMEFIS